MKNEGHDMTERLLQRFVDGEVTEDQDRAIRLHLRDHPAARLLVQELRGMRKLLAAAQVPETIRPPQAFAERVTREAFAEAGARVLEFRDLLPLVKRVAIFAAAAGLLVGVSWFWNRRIVEVAQVPEVGATPSLETESYPRDPLGEFRRVEEPREKRSATAGEEPARIEEPGPAGGKGDEKR